MDIEKANPILAEACGITLVETKEDIQQRVNCFTVDEWWINSSAIREIVRQRLDIETQKSRGFYEGWIASTVKFPPKSGDSYKIYQGKTIHEAEVACCLGVAEELNNK